MQDLPLLLVTPNINVNQFFSETHQLDMAFSGVTSICSIQTQITEMDLPVFSKMKYDVQLYTDMTDNHDVNMQVGKKIHSISSMDDSSHKPYEVEHYYIDFRALIVGEKIKATGDTGDKTKLESKQEDQFELTEL